ncbi:hypothetical protein EON63_07040 [archaeon]|nr:MAG: hypothetical protein EON63_07040 [archaeon]
MKTTFYQHQGDLPAYEAAVCGCVTGALAAALTTPLDVTKTRLMLGKVRWIMLCRVWYKVYGVWHIVYCR